MGAPAALKVMEATAQMNGTSSAGGEAVSDTPDNNELSDAITRARYRSHRIFEGLPAGADRAAFIAALAGDVPELPEEHVADVVDSKLKAMSRRGCVPAPGSDLEFLCDPAMLARRRTIRSLAMQMRLERRAVRHEPEVVAAGIAARAFDLESEPGLLGELARWSQTYAFRPVREFAAPAALAVLATVFGRRWATPTGLGLNLYLVAIGETGGGKDALLGAPKAILAKSGFRQLIGPGDFTSDAAIETSLRMHPSQLMPLDEFGKLAQALMGRNAPSFAKLAGKALLEIYPRSQPGSEWTGKQRADAMRDNAAEPVHSPTLSILGVSTPEGFFEGISQQNLEDGFLNRLTLVRSGKAGARQRDPTRLEPPAELVAMLQAAYEASAPAGNLADARTASASMAPSFRFARWADADAERAIEEVEAWEDDATEAGRRGVAGRAAEQTQKIATLRALARCPADPTVTAEDVLWAFAMVRSSIDTIEEGARAMMSGSEFEALCNAILSALAKAGPEGLPMSVLVRAKGIAKHEPRLVEAALKRLEMGEQIWSGVVEPKAGRPGHRYRVRDPEE